MIRFPAKLSNSNKYSGVCKNFGKTWYIHIFPHTQDGLFHYALVSLNKVQLSDKPVPQTGIEIKMWALGLEAYVTWDITSSERYEVNPYTVDQSPVVNRLDNERSLQLEIVSKLGVPCQTFVPCIAGIADIITETTIIEVKYILTSQNLFRAIGQVLVYRQAINPSLRPVIMGYRDESYQSDGIVEMAKQMGIEIIYWGE